MGGRWQVLSRGTTIGNRKLDRFAPVAVTGVRVRVEEAVGEAGLIAIGVYAQDIMRGR